MIDSSFGRNHSFSRPLRLSMLSILSVSKLLRQQLKQNEAEMIRSSSSSSSYWSSTGQQHVVPMSIEFDETTHTLSFPGCWSESESICPSISAKGNHNALSLTHIRHGKID